eukprot:gnl/MRDRNA2_/MRDRNA2_70154_c0_seq1.p1 gnl/MRDRNA2_/MRDRNA2_70154_c0~~gnl/MRDRNA2_/MRDRNA2_70154_c0_seq1.p1  ORF type:complete len:571 (+),score=104.83 gnl/MRDRNA2_/MRDRNA2_70154_c0_seq1:28-1740(+)
MKSIKKPSLRGLLLVVLFAAAEAKKDHSVDSPNSDRESTAAVEVEGTGAWKASDVGQSIFGSILSWMREKHEITGPEESLDSSDAVVDALSIALLTADANSTSLLQGYDSMLKAEVKREHTVSQSGGPPPPPRLNKTVKAIFLVAFLILVPALMKFQFIDASSHLFDKAIGAVILLNAIVMGLQTDLPHHVAFEIANNFFNLVFGVEFALRLQALGWAHLKSAWSWFDLLLAVTGTIDLWILPFVMVKNDADHQKREQMANMMRMLKLCRVLRIIRLFRMFNTLKIVADAFFGALTLVCWSGLMIVILNYVCAIVLTQLVGHHHGFSAKDALEINELFGTVGRSMFTLFQFMTCDDWAAVARIVVKELPVMLIFFVFYIVVASFTLVALMTGNVSDSLIAQRELNEVNKLQGVQANRSELIHTLRDLFGGMTKDLQMDPLAYKSRRSSKLELQTDERWQNPVLLENLKALGVDVDNTAGLHEVFDIMVQHMKFNDAGECSLEIEDFVEAMISMKSSATAKTEFLLRHEVLSVKNQVNSIEKRFSNLEGEVDRRFSNLEGVMMKLLKQHDI